MKRMKNSFRIMIFLQIIISMNFFVIDLYFHDNIKVLSSNLKSIHRTRRLMEILFLSINTFNFAIQTLSIRINVVHGIIHCHVGCQNTKKLNDIQSTNLFCNNIYPVQFSLSIYLSLSLSLSLTWNVPLHIENT